MSDTEKIIWRQAPGSLPPGRPFIELNIFSNQLLSGSEVESAKDSGQYKKSLALIDTGADSLYIDRRLAEEMSPKFIPLGESKVTSASALSETQYYDATIEFLASRRILCHQVHVVDLPGNPPYHVILGNSILKRFHLEINHQTKSYFLRYL